MVQLTLEQKIFLKFMLKYLNYNIKEIQNHPSMLRPDGTKFRLSTIKLWFDKVQLNQDLTKPTARSGRPSILNKSQVDNLVKMVEKAPKNRFNQIRQAYLRKYGISIGRRTLNNYLLRKNYRKCNFSIIN